MSASPLEKKARDGERGGEETEQKRSIEEGTMQAIKEQGEGKGKESIRGKK